MRAAGGRADTSLCCPGTIRACEGGALAEWFWRAATAAVELLLVLVLLLLVASNGFPPLLEYSSLAASPRCRSRG